MKTETEQKESYLYKCLVYYSLPNKIIDEVFICAENQQKAKDHTKRIMNNKRVYNILLITAEKINIYEYDK